MRIVSLIAPVRQNSRNGFPMSRLEYDIRQDDQNRMRKRRQRLSIALAGFSFSVLATADFSAIRDESSDIIQIMMYLYVLSAAVSLFACLIGAAFTYSLEPAHKSTIDRTSDKMSAQIDDVRGYCIRYSERSGRAQGHLIAVAAIGIMVAVTLMLLSIFAEDFVKELPELREWLLWLFVAAGSANSAWFMISSGWYFFRQQSPRPRTAIKANLVRIAAR